MTQTTRPAEEHPVHRQEAEGRVDIFHFDEDGKPLYIWQLPVRITHWVNVISISILTFTGLYIAFPFTYSPDAILGVTWLKQPTGSYFMGTVRYIHFVTAFIFTASVLLRIYWMFAGNKYASWRQYIPYKAARRRGIRRMLSYYGFVRAVPPAMIGHNPLAGSAYTALFGLYFVQIVTGFALYAIPFHLGFWPAAFGWVTLLFGVQPVRFVHMLIMFLIIAFVLHHVYTALLIDIEERSGLMSSIFTGYKYISASHWVAAEAEDAPPTPRARRRRASARRRDRVRAQ
jgi:Ni/Fe-hydrogenase, b-type cytochrome subunit